MFNDWFTKNNALGIGQNAEQQKATADLMRAQGERQGNKFGKGTISGLVFEAIENLFKGNTDLKIDPIDKQFYIYAQKSKENNVNNNEVKIDNKYKFFEKLLK